jgi:hypothetical protein
MKQNPHFNGCKMCSISNCHDFFMCEWIHICSDIDSGQNKKKTTRAFFYSLVTKTICYVWMDTHM